ncbi:hypothetical protein, partial [Escherichia coli]|uniref:hypothetical protein n=1 Tax=Escherichia coli TaxID=562 RepID=UPI0026667EA7
TTGIVSLRVCVLLAWLPPIKILTTIQGVALVVTTTIAIIRQAPVVHPVAVAPARAPVAHPVAVAPARAPAVHPVAVVQVQAPVAHPVAVVQVQAPVAHPAMTMAGLMVFWAG